jgi:hypothetical protein
MDEEECGSSDRSLASDGTKELLGTFKNNGREWQAKGEQTSVNVYDFLSLASGKAIRDARL